VRLLVTGLAGYLGRPLSEADPPTCAWTARSRGSLLPGVREVLAR
jgi:hypothetical protein